MIHEDEIKARLRAVIASQLSLEDFEEWLDGASWNMHQSSALGAVQAAGDALLLFSEYGLGRRSESSLRDELERLLNRIITDTLDGTPRTA